MSEPISYLEEVKRKLVHLSSLWMVVAILLIPGRWTVPVLFAVLLAITLISEHAYACRRPGLGTLYGALFGRMLRREPEPGAWIVSGGAPVLMAALLVTLLFDPLPAAGAMTVMLTADAAAALVGRRFGRHRAPNGKSWEGCAAFVVAGIVALTILFALTGAEGKYYIAGAIAVFPAAAAELFQKQLRVDDNFSIPLVVGVVLELAGRLC